MQRTRPADATTSVIHPAAFRLFASVAFVPRILSTCFHRVPTKLRSFVRPPCATTARPGGATRGSLQPTEGKNSDFLPRQPRPLRGFGALRLLQRTTPAAWRVAGAEALRRKALRSLSLCFEIRRWRKRVSCRALRIVLQRQQLYSFLRAFREKPRLQNGGRSRPSPSPGWLSLGPSAETPLANFVSGRRG